MTLGELLDNVCFQGNIEIRNVEENDTYYFDSSMGLSSATVEKESKGLFEECMEVKYIYSETFVKRYWNSTTTNSCLIIEVEK